MIRFLFNRTKKLPTPLGRWEHRITDKEKEIKAILTNIDHCGDKICGQPSLLKKIINKKNKFVNKKS